MHVVAVVQQKLIFIPKVFFVPCLNNADQLYVFNFCIASEDMSVLVHESIINPGWTQIEYVDPHST